MNALLKVATLQGRLCDIEQEKEKWMLEMELQQVKYEKQLQVQSFVITLAHGEECEGYAFGSLSLSLSLCLSGRVTQKLLLGLT